MTLKQYLQWGNKEMVESHKYTYDELKIFGMISLHDSERQLLDIEEMCLLTIKINELWNEAYNYAMGEIIPDEILSLFLDNPWLCLQTECKEEGYSQLYADRICDLIIDTFKFEEV